MSNEERSFTTRSEKKQRTQRSQKRKKMDRLLNVLIAIVSILIVLNLFAVFNDDNDKENEKEQEQVDETKEKAKEDVANQNSEKNEQTNDTVATDTEQSNESVEKSPNNNQPQQIVQSSDDPNVEEVIIDPNWKPTATKQTGEHISAYEEGHIDYQEKLVTFRNAVNLDENNVIFWSVKNNGSADSSVAVVSTNDRSEKYRIFIEWVQNEGWKPSKVEKLSQLEGTY